MAWAGLSIGCAMGWQESRRHTAREHAFWDTQPVPPMGSEYGQDSGPLDEIRKVEDVRADAWNEGGAG